MADNKDPKIDEPVIQEGIEAGLKDVDISNEVRTAFLDYSMSVIVSRAIPDVRDGLKPVHRRIIFGMNELGMQSDKPYKKCARIVGDVMGKFHPHGDQAIYSTLVRLAQPFSMRYTLVDGHGNFGSVDGDEAAAMRYTEARMAKMAMEMVKDIDDETVDFVDNYDGTEKEPVVLPSRFPNLLVNGGSGIAVGMATNMPTHNLREVVSAIKAYSKNPDIDVLELMQEHIQGPDFPTGGIILGKAGIRQAYEQGTGSLVIRSKVDIQEFENGKKRIIVKEIPYQVNKASMIETIADLVRNKVIEGITDIRDESNKNGIRVVIEVRRDIIPEVLLNQLYKHTQLQISFGIINLSLVNGQPKVLSLKAMMQHYLDHQIEVVERRTTYQLTKAEDRIHIVNGYLIGINNIDEIISILKKSTNTDTARTTLSQRFDLSERQTKEIVDMPLRRLTGLEKQKLEDEKIQLEKNITYFRELLGNRQMVIDVIMQDLDVIANKFGDDRLTEISDNLSSIEDEDLIPEANIVITMTRNGYIKRQAPEVFRTQNRGGRGVRGAGLNDNDIVSIIVNARTHTDILFFSNQGKVYRLRGYQIPEFARTAKGIPVVNLLNLEKQETIKSIISVDEYVAGHYLFFVTEKGVVKRTEIKEFESIRQNGKIAITLRDGDMLLDVKQTTGALYISLASSSGKMITFVESDVRDMGRTAAGVRGMKLAQDARVVGVSTTSEGKYVLVVTNKGFGKMTAFEAYRQTKRGAKGVTTIKASEKNGSLIAMKAANGDEDLLVVTKAGVIIRISLTQVRVIARATQGVRLIRLGDKESVSSIAIVEPSLEEPTEEVETVELDNPPEPDTPENDDDSDGDENGDA
jgi:DNA gyrase subunit A